MNDTTNPIHWTVTEYQAVHTERLRKVYLDSRKAAFYWLDPAAFQLEDFDAVIREEEVLVALHNDTPIGFIACWLPDNFIHSLFVDPAFTGKGVGKSLLKTCLEQIRRPATLKCLKYNKKALDFYQSQGWKIISDGEADDGAYYLMRVS